MTQTKKLYRVLSRMTAGVQPFGGTFWQTEVLYCGYDLDEARRAYHASRPLDYWHGYGNQARETVGQSKTFADE